MHLTKTKITPHCITRTNFQFKVKKGSNKKAKKPASAGVVYADAGLAKVKGYREDLTRAASERLRKLYKV
jgi:hypothetical protein